MKAVKIPRKIKKRIKNNHRYWSGNYIPIKFLEVRRERGKPRVFVIKVLK